MIRCVGCMEMREDGFDECPLCGYSKNTKYESYFLKHGCELFNGRYTIGNVLGRGGFGITYLAWDSITEKKVSIKEYFPSELSSRNEDTETLSVFSGNGEKCFKEGLASFMDEARRLAKLHQIDGVIEIYDCFEENNTAYIVMEYLEGETLASKLERENKMDIDCAINMMIPIMKSLSNVHKEGIIHRDISPDNIFILKDGTAKLIDFGAARMALIDQSKSLTVIVKSGYSPEEQYAADGNQGTWTDVYAMAATMYRMITGIKPADAVSRTSSIIKKGTDSLMTIKECGVSINNNVSLAIERAMQVNAENRTQTMQVFLNELENENLGKIKGHEKGSKKSSKIVIGKKVIIIAIIALIVLLFVITYALKFYPGKLIIDIIDKPVVGETSKPTHEENKVLTKTEQPEEKKEQVLVTEVVGLSEEDAIKLLEELGLEAECIYVENKEVENLVVISQEPGAQSYVEKNSVVKLQICKNEDTELEESSEPTTSNNKTGKTENKNDNTTSLGTSSNAGSSNNTVTQTETQATENPYKEYTYSISGNYVTLTKYNGSSTSVVIPTTIEGKNVTAVGAEAFKNNTTIKTVSIPNNIISIGEGAFSACTNLQNISLSDNITSIPNKAFQNCLNINNIAIPSKVTSIGASAFEGCMALGGIELPSGLLTIGEAAFANCKGIKEVKFTNKITEFGAKAFYGCSNLSKIDVPAFNAKLGDNAFGSTNISTINLNYIAPLNYGDFVKSGVSKEVDVEYYGGVNIMPTLKKYFEPYGLINYGTLKCDANDVMTITTDSAADVHTAGYVRSECDIAIEVNSDYIFRCDVYENTGKSMEIFVFNNCDVATTSFPNTYFDMYYTRTYNSETIKFSTDDTSSYIRIRFDTNNTYSTLKIKNAKLFKIK